MKSNKHLRIAIDGESGSGKSYASKIIGKKYKCYILNSGLAYRYASYLIIKNKPKKINIFLRKKFKNLNYKKLIRINLHSEKISYHVASLATIKSVRDIIKSWERKIVLKNSRILVEGRDSASVILKKNPKCDYVVYALAVSMCQLGDDENSLSNLKEAIRLKSENRFLAQRDSDFEPLLNDSRFISLVFPKEPVDEQS